jgi:putative ABC transport system permease protein
MLESLWQDLRFAFRSLLKTPGFTLIVLVTLVAGMASVTAIFSFVNAAYLADLPYRDAKRIVAVRQSQGLFVPEISNSAVRLVRENARSFERIAVFATTSSTIVIGEEPRIAQVLQVDTGFTTLLQMRAAVGRLPTHEEIVANAGVAAISHELWRTQFGSDPAVIGRSVAAVQRQWQIVGVLPELWDYPGRTQLLTPMPPLPVVVPGSLQDGPDFHLIGKLRVGVTREDAAAELRVLSARMPKYPRRVTWSSTLDVAPEMLNRRAQSLMPFPVLFVGMGVFVLLIACANVGNLFLARGAERRSEIAVRAAMGASRVRLIRGLLCEALLLGSAAAVLGLAASVLLVNLSWQALPTQNWPMWLQVSVDFRVLLFAFAALLLVTLTVGLSPALEGTKLDLARALKIGGGGSGSTGQVMRSVSRGLVAQLAMSVALFVCSALLVRTYLNVARVDLGYPAEQIAVAAPWFNDERHADKARRIPMLEEVARGLRGAPGVTHAEVAGRFSELRTASTPKLTDNEKAHQLNDWRLIPDGVESRGEEMRPQATQLAVSDGYFGMLGLRVREGRGFVPDDRETSAGVAVVSVSLARHFWPTQTAIGHTLQNGKRGERLTIVGVVDDVNRLNFGGRADPDRTALPEKTLYVSTRQAVSWYPAVYARGDGNVGPLRALMLSRLREVDPLFIYMPDVTMASNIERSLMVLRIFGGAIGFFALVALFLTVIGIYGVVAFGVARRVREIGVRIALGGSSRDVIRHIMGGTGRFMVVGLVLGLGLSVMLGRFMTVFLYGTSPLDPVAYLAVCGLFVVVALVASYLPARKATSVDPLVALRSE